MLQIIYQQKKQILFNFAKKELRFYKKQKNYLKL